MGSVQQAVWEFDEAVQAPWRPPLASGVRPVTPLRLVHPQPQGPAPARQRPDRSPARAGAPGRRRPATRVGSTPPLRVPAVPPGRRAGGAQVDPTASERHTTSGVRPASGLHLTRRARRLVAALVLAAAVATGSWLGPLLTGGEGDLRLAGVSSVVVEPGDTLWSIASSTAGGEDVRQVIDEIQRLNGLHGTQLQPGQVLRLP